MHGSTTRKTCTATSAHEELTEQMPKALTEDRLRYIGAMHKIVSDQNSDSSSLKVVAQSALPKVFNHSAMAAMLVFYFM